MRSINLLLLTITFLSAPFMQSGVTGDTLVNTIDGKKFARDLKENDVLVSCNYNFETEYRPITSINSAEIKTVIEITLHDNSVMRVSPGQKFFVGGEWINAQDLTINSFLITKDFNLLRVKSISHLQQTERFFFLEVEDFHNFYAADNNILVHNGPITGWCMYWVVKGGAYTGICAGSAVVVGSGAGVIAIGGAAGATAGGVATAAISTAAPVSVGAAVFGTGVAAGTAAAGGTTAIAGASIAAGVQSVGVIAATATAVESGALATGLFFAGIPFLP